MDNNCNSLSNIYYSLKGPKGDIGPQGNKGNKGCKGIRGDIGGIGDRGDKGNLGLQGLKVLKGNNGIRGLKGNKGNTGDIGDKGLRGQIGGNFIIFKLNTQIRINESFIIFMKNELNDTYENVNEVIVSIVDYRNINIEDWLKHIKNNDYIKLLNENNYNNYGLFKILNITSSLYNNIVFYTLKLQSLVSNGVFNITSNIIFNHILSGPKGSKGNVGDSSTDILIREIENPINLNYGDFIKYLSSRPIGILDKHIKKNILYNFYSTPNNYMHMLNLDGNIDNYLTYYTKTINNYKSYKKEDCISPGILISFKKIKITHISWNFLQTIINRINLSNENILNDNGDKVVNIYARVEIHKQMSNILKVNDDNTLNLCSYYRTLVKYSDSIKINTLNGSRLLSWSKHNNYVKAGEMVCLMFSFYDFPDLIHMNDLPNNLDNLSTTNFRQISFSISGDIVNY